MEIILEAVYAVGRVILKLMQSSCKLNVSLLVEDDEGGEIVIDKLDGLICFELILKVALKHNNHRSNKSCPVVTEKFGEVYHLLFYIFFLLVNLLIDGVVATVYVNLLFPMKGRDHSLFQTQKLLVICF
jgi:hypothetical protein